MASSGSSTGWRIRESDQTYFTQRRSERNARQGRSFLALPQKRFSGFKLPVASSRRRVRKVQPASLGVNQTRRISRNAAADATEDAGSTEAFGYTLEQLSVS
jgi:hypothetical protein